ncbi:unnamed protein product [Urochloa humidicola]
MGRSPCCDKASVKRGPWSAEEDARLRSYMERHGGAAVGGWMALPREAGLRRCGKSCRLRWLNYLRPGVRHGGFSPEEDRLICALHAAVGSRWSLIAAHLPGRTDNGVKNYWNTRLKKKLHLQLRQQLLEWRQEAASSVVSLSPPLAPWTTTGAVDQMSLVGAGGGRDDMIVVSQLSEDASYSSEPAAATELDEIFRSMGTTTGVVKHSDQSQSSTEIETSRYQYQHCQRADGETVLQQQHQGMPYLYW